MRAELQAAKALLQLERTKTVKPQKAPKAPKTPSQKLPLTAGFYGDAGKSMRISFKEETPMLAGNTVITSRGFTLNPFDPVFTRLPSAAALYNLWRFTHLTVTWMPNGSAFAANNQTGQVVLSIGTDLYITPPNSIAIAASRKPAVVGDAWTPCHLKVPQSHLGMWRFVRDGAGVQGGDARLTDILMMATLAGTPNTNAVGYLLLEGEVELCQEYTPNSSQAGVQWGPFTSKLAAYYGGGQALTTGVAKILPIFSASNSLSASLLVGAYSISPDFMQFAPGSYLVRMTVTVTAGTSLTALVLAFTAGNFTQYSNLSFSKTGLALTADTMSAEWVGTVAEANTGLQQYSVTATGSGALTLTNFVVTVCAL